MNYILYIDKSCTIEVSFGAKLQLTGSQVAGEWGDISYVPHAKEGLKKTLKPKSKSSVRHSSKSAQIQIPICRSYMLPSNTDPLLTHH